MKITLNVPSQKLNFMLELLESLDFIEIESSETTENDKDWWFELSPKQQERIKASLTKLDKGEVLSNEEVKSKVNRLFDSKNKA